MSCHGPGGSGTVTILNRSDSTFDAQAAQDGQAVLGATVVDFVRAINERKLEKRLGQMLANGDCAGAARHAFEKGRLELGQAIANKCAALSAQPRVQASQNLPFEELVSLVKRAADAFQPGFDLGEGVIVNRFVADGGTLIVDAKIDPSSNPNGVRRIVCQNPGMQTVYMRGATIALPVGAQEIRVTRADCGI